MSNITIKGEHIAVVAVQPCAVCNTQRHIVSYLKACGDCRRLGTAECCAIPSSAVICASSAVAGASPAAAV